MNKMYSEPCDCTFKNGPILNVIHFLICEERNSTTILKLFTIDFLDINFNTVKHAYNKVPGTCNFAIH